MNKTLKETREMKDSGIEWISVIPKEWELTKASILFKAEKGKNAQTYTKEYIGANPGVYPVYSGQTENDGIMGTINTFVYDKEVIFSTTVGAKAMTPKLISGKFSLSQNCMIANLRQAADIRFFYYQCIPLFSHYKNLISQYMQPSFTVEEFLSYRFIIPPLSEQQAIANYLDEQVGKIEELIVEQKQAIENWKAYKQSLITEKVTKGLNPNVEMKDSGIEWIGEIPKAWEVKKSKYLMNFRTGLSITKKDFVESGYKTINYGQIHSKYTFDLDLTRDDLFKVSFDYAQSNPLTILKKGDFVFCDTSEDLNGCGNCVLVENTNEEVLLAGSHTTIGRLKEKSIPRYMAYLFKSDKVRAQIRANVVGIKVFSITQKILNNTFLIIPPLYEQQQIADFLDEKCSKIDQTIEQKQVLIQQLEEYKQSLIYECVTGKRCVL